MRIGEKLDVSAEHRSVCHAELLIGEDERSLVDENDGDV